MMVFDNFPESKKGKILSYQEVTEILKKIKIKQEENIKKSYNGFIPCRIIKQ